MIEIGDQLVGLAPGGAVADRDQLDPCLRDSCAERVQRAVPVVPRLVRIDTALSTSLPVPSTTATLTPVRMPGSSPIVDATGKVVDTAVIYPHEPQRQWNEALAIIGKLALKHRVELIAIGNGTASRETEKLAGELVKGLAELKLTKIVVSEAGASVYSASAFASQELPGLDVTLRGAVSIARRLQDPLAELVKIDPKAIGVGQYQHDVGQAKLARSLDAVVEDCVNAVGVDVNTASVPLLPACRASAPALAASIVAHRDANGPFTSRKALKDVPRLGPKAFEQCAGFLRIRGGDDPLDASAVHPEAYPVVRRISAPTKSDIKALIGNSEIVRTLKPTGLRRRDLRSADGHGHPARAREARPRPASGVQDRGVQGGRRGDQAPPAGHDARGRRHQRRRLRRLRRHRRAPGRAGSRLGDGQNFIKDPREVVKPGDIVKVKVLDFEVARKRISLTLRLDDEVGAKKDAPGMQRDNSSRNPARMTSSAPRKQESSGGGALAEAMRRAAEKNGGKRA